MANKKRRCSQCKSYKIADDGIVIRNTFFCDIDCATAKAFNGIEKGKEEDQVRHSTIEKRESPDHSKPLLVDPPAPMVRSMFKSTIRQDQTCDNLPPESLI